jgi:metal-responsive CopG/Arc/MetJ family transcriptional regulator
LYIKIKTFMRHKLNDEDKKKDFSISMDQKLNKILEEYLTKKGISNKSKYIESLVKKDLESKGEKFDNEF